MKHYVGLELIQAAPAISKGSKIYEYGEELPEADAAEVGEDGYKIVYPSGLVSWRPKEVFESMYLELELTSTSPNGFEIKVTQKMVDDFIASVDTTDGLATVFVTATLRNGFKLVEMITSSATSPSNLAMVDMCLTRIKSRVHDHLEFLLHAAVFGIDNMEDKL